MMIQGSNNPLVVQFDGDVSACPKLAVSLWGQRGAVKVWTLEDMQVSGDTAICPVTEEETAALCGQKLMLEAKGLDAQGNTIFWDSVAVYVKQRKDKTIQLTTGA